MMTYEQLHKTVITDLKRAADISFTYNDDCEFFSHEYVHYLHLMTDLKCNHIITDNEYNITHSIMSDLMSNVFKRNRKIKAERLLKDEKA